MLKINIDGAFVPETGGGAITFICCDSISALIDSGSRSVRVSSTIQVEGVVIIEPLRSFQCFRDPQVELKSDQLELVLVISHL